MDMTRAEHIAWCKVRALEYLPDDPAGAVSSMLSDLNRHEETVDPIGVTGLLLTSALLSGAEAVRTCIEGF